MELTPEELEALEPGSYTLLDLRSEQETAYGTIPGSVPANAAALPEGLPAEPGRIVLFCTRGKLSLETAERLRDEGFDACSLKGGYLAWLMRQMQRQEAEELCSRVENSLRKRFRLKLWCNFTKAIRQYERPYRRVHVRRKGLHAHGKAFSGAAALYEVSLLGGIPRYGPRLQPGESPRH